MAYGIYVATAGAVARQNQIDVAANNIANASTTGYRRVSVSFEEVLHDAKSENRHMTMSSGTHVDQSSGALHQTGNKLDLALRGPGYFVVGGRGQSEMLVRSLSAQANAAGEIVDTEGRPLQTTAGRPLVVDPRLELQIDRQGNVTQNKQRLGTLRVASAPDVNKLTPVGHGAYTTNEKSGAMFDIESEVLQGALEQSNVKPVTSMVQLISLERDYQSLMRAVQAYREADTDLLSAQRR